MAISAQDKILHVANKLGLSTDNRFEVNEALLIETVAFYAITGNPAQQPINLIDATPGASNLVVVFDVVIGNKVVMKDMPVWQIGSPACFATGGLDLDTTTTPNQLRQKPRHQVYMEGVGILIPPQVEFSVNARVFDAATGAPANAAIGCYLFGTKVNLNFNTTL